MTHKDLAASAASLSRSPLVEQAMQELARMPLTEACVSGLCEICLSLPACLCDIVARPGTQPDSSRRPRN